MQYHNGWWWPSDDKMSHIAAHNKMLEALDYALGFVKKRRVCIQAGGAVGIWPHHLSRYFEQVYTFEPDPLQFECLHYNVSAINVYKYHLALGEQGERLGVVHNTDRCNASFVERNPSKDRKIVSSIRLGDDPWPEMPVDFISLDVEGYDRFVLKGAEELFKAQNPVVRVEDNRAERYGFRQDDVNQIMGSYKYRLLHIHKRNKVFAKR